MIDIRLLGDFNLAIDGVSVTSVNSTRLQSLLAYLLLHCNAQQSRKHLAFIFWADKTEAQAHNNLRQALHQLRQALPNSDGYIYADASTLQWRRDSDFLMDVVEFETAIDAACLAEKAGDFSAQKTSLEKALSLYRGELLPFCYDDWIIPERERLHQMYLDALERMVHLLEKQRNYSNAIPYAKQLLQSDQLNENSYRTLMRMYALNGERANALRIYHNCADTLQREIGVEPESATQEIYQRLLNQKALPSAPAAPPELTSLPPMVGRNDVWEQLIAVWHHAMVHGPHFVLLSGDAGIGKTRLAEEMLSWSVGQGISTAKTRAYAAEGRLPYGPISDLLRGEAIRPSLKNLAKVWQVELARLLPELLAESPEMSDPEPLKEYWQRQSFFQAMAHAIFLLPQPILLLIDDLQWCDPETLEWIHYLLRAEPRSRLLVVGTARLDELAANQAFLDFLFDLRRLAQVSEIQLRPLDAAETAMLAAHMTGQELDTDTALYFFSETEGNPLFILEMIRSGYLKLDYSSPIPANLLPDYSRAVHDKHNLPTKVYAVLLARLAKLSPAVLQLAYLAATIGRGFSVDILTRASDASDDELARWLDELWRHRIVRPRDEKTYDFTHDKLREVAYAEVSPPQRRQLHLRIGCALEERYFADPDPVSGQLAAHFEQARISEKAIHYYYRAALVAQRVNANQEAIGLMKKALALLQTLAEDHERDRREMDIQTTLGVSLIDTLGHGSPEVIQVYDRILVLCQRLGQTPTPSILRALAINHIVRAEFRQALGYSEKLILLADRQEERALKVEANYATGVTMFWLGAFQSSRNHLEHAIALYEPKDSQPHITLYSHDPNVICLSRLAFNLWFLGYPGQALNTSLQALNCAQKLAHPFSMAYAMLWNVMLLIHLRAFAAARERIEALIGLCREQHLRHFLLESTALLGLLQAECGEIEAGITMIRDGMEHFRAGGAEFKRPFFLSLLAEQYGRKGDIQQGLALLKEARELMEKSEERWCEAEILRRQGELLMLQSKTMGAEEALKHALLVARNQEAKMLELRAALALGRLWLRQGKDRQAEGLIAPLYNWFRDGLDVPDMNDTRLLLEKIN